MIRNALTLLAALASLVLAPTAFAATNVSVTDPGGVNKQAVQSTGAAVNTGLDQYGNPLQYPNPFPTALLPPITVVFTGTTTGDMVASPTNPANIKGYSHMACLADSGIVGGTTWGYYQTADANYVGANWSPLYGQTASNTPNYFAVDAGYQWRDFNIGGNYVKLNISNIGTSTGLQVSCTFSQFTPYTAFHDAQGLSSVNTAPSGNPLRLGVYYNASRPTRTNNAMSDLYGTKDGALSVSPAPTSDSWGNILPFSTTAAPCLVLKSSAGSFYGSRGYTSAASWIFVIDSATAPSSPSTITPIDVAYTAAGGQWDINSRDMPERVANGAVVCVSSTAPPTYTAFSTLVTIQGIAQ